MRRSVDHYGTDGRLIAGYDYINQAWVKDGRYVDCAHPQKDCSCYGREHKGEQPPIGCRYMSPSVMDRFLLRWWQCYSQGMLDQHQVQVLTAWTNQELQHA
jgi:hypothetical protein